MTRVMKGNSGAITENSILRRFPISTTKPIVKYAAVFAISVFIHACGTHVEPDMEKAGDLPRIHDAPVIVTSPPKPGGGFTFGRAEKLFSEKRYGEAIGLYTRILRETAPSDPLADNAYFKIGLSLFETGRYRDALHYFETLPEKFPNSDVSQESLLNSAICHFYLNDHEKAEALFSKAFSGLGSPGKRAYVHFFRAGMATRKGRFDQAVKLYVKSEVMADSERLVKTARARMEKIFHNFLGEKSLRQITVEYSGTWPSQTAFKELINIYRRSENSALLDKTMEEYKAQFPPRKKIFGRWFTDGNEYYKPDAPKIGVVLPLTGSGERAGREILQGIQLAFNSLRDLANTKGVQPIIKDSASDPKRAETVLEELARDRDIIVVLGPAFSEAFKNAASIADGYKMPVFSPSASAESLASLSGRLFRNTITNSLEAKKIANLAVNDLGLKRFAVISPNDNYGREITGFFVREVERLGGLVVTAEWYDPAQTDFRKQIRNIGGMSDESLRSEIMTIAELNPEAKPETINSIIAERGVDGLTSPRIESYGQLPITSKNFRPGLGINYDAVFLPGLYEKVGLILPELTFYNLKNIVRITGKYANHKKFLSIAEKYAEGVIFLDGFFAEEDSPHVKNFVRNYRLAFREEPTLLAAQAYDAARIALSGIAHGASSRNAMTKYLQNVRFFEGVSGMTSMEPTGNADKTMVYLTVKDGQIMEFDPLDYKARTNRTGGLPPAINDEPAPF